MMNYEKDCYTINYCSFKYLFNNIKNVDKEFIKQTCFIHKLSYKFDSNLTTKENTVYQSILKGEF